MAFPLPDRLTSGLLKTDRSENGRKTEPRITRGMLKTDSSNPKIT